MYSHKEKWSFSFSPFPLSKIKYQFWILLPKSFKTVDPSERSEETSPVTSYKIISQGYQANFPLQNSSSSTQTSSPSPAFPQYPEELRGGRGIKTKQGCYCPWQSSGRGDRNPKGRCRGRKGSALGSPAGHSHVLQQSQHDSRAISPWAFCRARQGQAKVAGRRMIIQSNLLPCQAAVCTFQLIKPKDWGEFQKLNP